MTAAQEGGATTAPGRRLPDRRRQLMLAAAELFRRDGYTAVGIDEIAARAGVTGPAFYRHFPTKAALLADLVRSGYEALDSTLDEVLARPVSPARRLSALTATLAGQVLDDREATGVWRRESRHLPPAERSALRADLGSAADRVAGAVTAARPGLAVADAALIGLAAGSVLASAADHHLELRRPYADVLMARLADAVLAADLPPAVVRPPDPGAAALARLAEPVPRREQILTSATALFREHGFRAVSVDDIGAAVGIAGPSVYRHFASKAELLFVASLRVAEQLLLAATRATVGAASPAAALAGLAGSYLDVWIAQADLAVVYAREAPHLDPRDRDELVRLQRIYVAIWVQVVRAVSPGVPAPTARVATHAALAIANDLAPVRDVARPTLRDDLLALQLAVLGSATGVDLGDVRESEVGDTEVGDREPLTSPVPKSTFRPPAV